MYVCECVCVWGGTCVPVCFMRVCLCVCMFLQVSVYMGKRDFVDHVHSVEPVGEFYFLFFHQLLIPTQYRIMDIYMYKHI